MTASRDVTVAALQVTSFNGEAQRNLDNAAIHVADAAARGAELIVCPEFLAAGYIYDESIWASAEPADGGLTERWLSDLAGTHRALVGAGYLEVEGDDFFNTFALYGSRLVVRNGEEAACYRLPLQG